MKTILIQDQPLYRLAVLAKRCRTQPKASLDEFTRVFFDEVGLAPDGIVDLRMFVDRPFDYLCAFYYRTDRAAILVRLDRWWASIRPESDGVV